MCVWPSRHSPVIFDVAGLLSRFRARYPQVTISLSTGLIAELLGKLETGQVDVVIGPVGACR